MRAVPVIAIDGPSSSGKGTVASLVARRLGFHLLESGALYRLVALASEHAGIPTDNDPPLAGIAARLDARFEGGRVLLGGADVTEELRSEACGMRASAISSYPFVRKALLQRQRGFRLAPGLVADGRDMGTVVFPDAVLKVFLTASLAERAARRHKQLKEKGIDATLAALSRDLEERDARDATRAVAPLAPAADAVQLDSSGLPIDEVVARVVGWYQEKTKEFRQ
ncbi:MAG: (d)CMP kinase [Betaproteobacteria bacterium]|nr:(d)CMP kinase [Betaproteobacteria bacterium]